MIRVVVLAPIDNSLYARLICYRLRQESGVQLAGIQVRSPWNINRFRTEFGRDGIRLLRKVLDKWVRGDQRFSDQSGDNLMRLAERWELPFKSLRQLAQEYNIPRLVVSDHNHRRSQEFLNRIAPDLIVFTGGGLIRPSILSIPSIGVLNCHTGILPQYRGMDVVEWTAAEERIGEVGFGATLHLMGEGVDTGPIIKKVRLDAGSFKTFSQIRASLEVRMVELMLEGVLGFRDKSFTPVTQNSGEGRQYFVMHPRMRAFAELRLLRQLKNS
jgi:folate-dependent phosphoribosylglycinamide formyltransferase PurN